MRALRGGRVVNVLGFDPGLAHLGWGAVRASEGGLRFLGFGTISTEKGHEKKVTASGDNVRRAREMATEIEKIFDRFNPALICAESMSHPPSASNAAKMSIAWGLIVYPATLRGIDLIDATPKAIKLALTGASGATKADVIAAVAGLFALDVEARLPKADREHACDALGAIVTLQNAPTFRKVVR